MKYKDIKSDESFIKKCQESVHQINVNNVKIAQLAKVKLIQAKYEQGEAITMDEAKDAEIPLKSHGSGVYEGPDGHMWWLNTDGYICRQADMNSDNK